MRQNGNLSLCLQMERMFFRAEIKGVIILKFLMLYYDLFLTMFLVLKETNFFILYEFSVDKFISIFFILIYFDLFILISGFSLKDETMRSTHNQVVANLVRLIAVF